MPPSSRLRRATSPERGQCVDYGGTQADALKSYGEESFTYNAYGYPTGYYNGSHYAFSWDKYGNLSGATKGSKTLFYSYDISGLRTSKVISGGLSQTYYYDGDRLIGQVCSDGTAIMFNYGTDGEMFGFSRMVDGYQYDYYYVKNAQGDVLKVMNQNMDVVARYYYDAWGAIRQVQDGDGNIISDTTSQNCIANINPIRYRGYYYDVETGLYYLRSRYYDPEIGRFISRDSYEYLGANGDLGSYNLFAYCSNNPVKCIDASGEFALTLSTVGSVGFCIFTAVCADGILYCGVQIVKELDFDINPQSTSMPAAEHDYVYRPLPGEFDPGPEGVFELGTEGARAEKFRSKARTKSDAIPNTIADTRFDQKQYNYWEADLVGKEFRRGKGLSASEAAFRVASGGNVLCINEDAALYLIHRNNYQNAVGPEISYGEGFYWHYHPTRNHAGKNSTHIWFLGLPKKLGG